MIVYIDKKPNTCNGCQFPKLPKGAGMAVCGIDGRIISADARKDCPLKEIVDCTDFMNWLIVTVLGEMRLPDSDVLGEIICRRLKKLGLLDVNGGYYCISPAVQKAARKLAYIHSVIDLYDDRPDLHEEEYWAEYLLDPEWHDPDIEE
jgi:hypothetical protein